MANDAIILPAELSSRISSLAQAAAPAECCGALLGNSDFTTSWEVQNIVELTNRSPNTGTEYLITSDDVRYAQRKARALGLDVVGFFHSHPNGRSAPSATDLERAWPGYVYVIVAGAAVGAFTLDEQRNEFRAVALA